MRHARILKYIAPALFAAAGTRSHAQLSDSSARSISRHASWELLGSSGALVPTGTQRGALRTAPTSTAQVLYVIRSRVAVSAMLGWARSRDLLMEDAPKLSVFTYDLGVETRGTERSVARRLTIFPFAGVGAGARSYDHRGVDDDATHVIAGYASAGAELGLSRVRLRVEARDYVSTAASFMGSSAGRNDVALVAGLRIARHRAPEQ